MDELKYFNLDNLLFEGDNSISKKFNKDGFLNAEDFFCILIWKANRAKSKHANRLLKLNPTKNLESICLELTKSIFQAHSDEERYEILRGKKYKFKLPTTSAILAVYNPVKFSIYDYRACDILKEFKDFSKINSWEKYNEFNNAVNTQVKQYDKLRDKDRYLWGKSFHTELIEGLKNNFINQNFQDIKP
jgi:hypothetical protein